MKTSWFAVVLLLLFVGGAYGADHYVSPTGSASWANSTNIATPSSWATARANAAAGDTVYLRGGTYTFTHNVTAEFTGTLFFTNSGTPTNWIHYTAYPGEIPVFNWTGTNRSPGSYEGVGMHVIGKSYLKFSRITFRGNNQANCVFFWLEAREGGYSAHHITFDSNIFEDYGGGDNVGVVYINHGANDITFTNNTVTGPCLNGNCAGIHGNTSGVIALNAERLVFNNNSIKWAQIGLYYKHGQNQSQPGIEIAYNYFSECPRYLMELNCEQAHIHNNIFGKSTYPGADYWSPGRGLIRINEDNGGTNGESNTIEYNSFYPGTSLAISEDSGNGKNNILRYNVFYAETAIWPYTGGAHGTIITQNLYYNSASTSGGYWIAGSHLAATARDSGALNDAGSYRYAGGANPTLVSSYALAPNSAGKSACNGKDCGADVSLVGVNSSGTLPLKPNPPSRLIVQ